MRTLLRFGFLLSTFTQTALADIWMADSNSVYKLDPTGNQIALTLASPNTDALAVDPSDGSVWILSDKRLSKRSPIGALTFDSDLKSLGLDGASFLALDSRDGSIWISQVKDQRGAKIAVHLDSVGFRVGARTNLGSDDLPPTSLSI